MSKTQTDGVIQFCIDVRPEQMATWTADRIERFFAGVAQVVRAADGSEGVKVNLPDHRVPPVAKPRFKHNCDECQFLGHVDDGDTYGHPHWIDQGVVILTVRRSGNSVSEVRSVAGFVHKTDAFAFAQRQAEERGLFTRGASSEHPLEP